MTFQLNDDERFDDEFLEEVVKQVQKKVKEYISPKKIDLFLDIFMKMLNANIPRGKALELLYKSIMIGINKLTFRKNTKGYQIYIPNTIYIGRTKITVALICEMIDAGVLNVPGTHMFTKAFHFVSDRIDKLYNVYSGKDDE